MLIKWSSLSHFVPYSRLFTNFPNFLKCDKLDQPRWRTFRKMSKLKRICAKKLYKIINNESCQNKGIFLGLWICFSFSPSLSWFFPFPYAFINPSLKIFPVTNSYQCSMCSWIVTVILFYKNFDHHRFFLMSGYWDLLASRVMISKCFV